MTLADILYPRADKLEEIGFDKVIENGHYVFIKNDIRIGPTLLACMSETEFDRFVKENSQQ